MVDLQSRPTGHRHPTLGQRHRVRHALSALLSAVVVLLGAVYVFAPDGETVRLSVTELRGAQPYDVEVQPRYSLVSARMAAPKPKWTEIVYGKLSAKNVPVTRATLKISGSERATRGQRASIAVPTRGVYRAALHLRPGRYTLTLTVVVGRRTSIDTATRALRDGRFYSVSGSVRPSGIVTFLPVTSY